MTKCLLVVFVAFGFTCFAQTSSKNAATKPRQPENESAASTQPQGQPVVNSGQATLQGCLTGAAFYYDLIDASGHVYLVEGDDRQLSSYIGQEVRVTGTTSEWIPANTETSHSSWTRPQLRIRAGGVQKVFDACAGSSQ